MRLSRFFKNNDFFSFHLSGPVVLLLVLLQLAAWYPFLSQMQSDVDRHIRLKDRVENEWRQIQNQAIRLRDVRFVDMSWVEHHITATENDIATQWSVSGSASVLAWQRLLEQVEEQFSLILRSVHWQRETNGHWRGQLLFSLNVPKKNREYHHWLPTKLRTSRFNRSDWQLVSTMRLGTSTAALITYKNHRRWIRQGSWLPEAGMTVNTVSFDRVILMAKDGSSQALVVRGRAQNE